MANIVSVERHWSRARGAHARRRRVRPARLQVWSYSGVIALGLLALLGTHHYLGLSLPGLSALGPAPEIVATTRRHFPICSSGARVDCIVDGDTFWFAGEKVRIADIDTPEIFSPSCRAEKRLGEQAKRRLHALMNAGPVELRRAGLRDTDLYGRLLRTVWRDGRSLGDTLVAEGLAHRWGGFRRSWCGGA